MNIERALMEQNRQIQKIQADIEVEVEDEDHDQDMADERERVRNEELGTDAAESTNTNDA